MLNTKSATSSGPPNGYSNSELENPGMLPITKSNDRKCGSVMLLESEPSSADSVEHCKE